MLLDIERFCFPDLPQACKCALCNLAIIPRQGENHFCPYIINHGASLCVKVFHKCAGASCKGNFHKLVCTHVKIIAVQGIMQCVVPIRFNYNAFIHKKVGPILAYEFRHAQGIPLASYKGGPVIDVVFMKRINLSLIPFHPRSDLLIKKRRHCAVSAFLKPC